MLISYRFFLIILKFNDHDASVLFIFNTNNNIFQKEDEYKKNNDREI